MIIAFQFTVYFLVVKLLQCTHSFLNCESAITIDFTVGFNYRCSSCIFGSNVSHVLLTFVAQEKGEICQSSNFREGLTLFYMSVLSDDKNKGKKHSHMCSIGLVEVKEARTGHKQSCFLKVLS